MHFPTWNQLIVLLSLFALCSEIAAPPPNPANTPVEQLDTSHKSTKNHPKISKVKGSDTDRKNYEVPLRLPLMDFDIPQTYAGLMDLSEGAVTDKLFFMYVPTQNPAGLRDLALWTNGGPGCSSLLGGFQENGPVMWDQGRNTPIANENSWHKKANMLYVEHPANVGFSTGNIMVNNEHDVARYLFKFVKKFLTIFPEMRGANFYVTGESYGGYYVSYAAEYMYRHQAQLALKLQGILLVDPVISLDQTQSDAPMVKFLQQYNDKYIHLSKAVVQNITATDQRCGASKFFQERVRFPPPENYSLEDVKLYNDPTCVLWGQMAAALDPREFNIYNIAQQSHAFDFATQNKGNYFDRPEVRKALNAEQGSAHWEECTGLQGNLPMNIFPKGDNSLIPTAVALPFVLERSQRVVILHGKLDGLLLVDGMILALQNFFWGGKRGFQNPINRPLVVGGKRLGEYQSERKLTFIQVDDAGHMVPHDQPLAGLAAFEYLLGRTAHP